MERKNCYVSSTINTASEGYKQSSRTVQNKSGKMFIETEVQPQAGDTILDLGCGTGELSAYLAQLVGNSGKVVGVDPDKERLQLAKNHTVISTIFRLSRGALQTSLVWAQNPTTLSSATTCCTGSQTNPMRFGICTRA